MDELSLKSLGIDTESLAIKMFGKPIKDLDSDQVTFVIDSMNRIVDNLLKNRNGGIVSLNQLTQPLGVM